MVSQNCVVDIDRVTKTFGSVIAVSDLSLTVPKGSICGFIGPNGSGKTTTLRMIMRIHHPDPGVGSIRVLGLENQSAANDRVGYLPEERGLYKKMKVRDLLGFYAELKGYRDFKVAVNEWLDRLGLADWADRKVETLSKGMAQKVQFISAVVHQPDLVILDEPFSGLDPVNLNVMREAVLDLRRRGATVILSTHDMSVAEQMCDFIFMIFRGKKVLDGTLEAIQADYGQNTLRVGVDCDDLNLESIDGVENVVDLGHLKDLRVHKSVDTQQVLAALLRQGRVTHFEVTRPSLHDIFVRIAGPEARTPNDAASQQETTSA